MDLLTTIKRIFARQERITRRNAATSKSHRAINGLLINPFAGQSRAEMAKLIKDFLNKTELDIDKDLLTRGALLSQDPHAFSKEEERKDGLTLKKREREALHIEATQRFNQPVKLYALIGICSAGAAVQGWDEAVANQAQLYFYRDLQTNLNSIIYKPSFSLALINSAPWLSAAAVGVWLTDPINRFAGRRGALFVACSISCIACIFQALSAMHTDHPEHQFKYQLILSRFLLGIGIGLKSTTAPIFAAECTPKAIRGALVMSWQMWTAFGLMLGYLSGVIFSSSPGDLRWRLTLGSPALLALLVCACIYSVPESPRLLILRARRGDRSCYQKAFNSLISLRTTKLQAVRDLFLIYHQVRGEERIRKHRNRFIELFIVGRNRRALVSAVLTMFFQQFCGVNVLAYYSSLVFLTALCPSGQSCPNLTHHFQKAVWLSFGFGAINFVFALPAIPLIDKLGRRTLLLTTFPFMALFHLLTGLAFQLPHGTALTVCVTLGMYIFDVFYSLGEGPVPFVYASECMPLAVRDYGMSVAVAMNWIFNWLLAITLTQFWGAFHPTGTFLYYAAWCVVGFFLILILVPETKGKSLEELDAIFSIPTATHAAHGWAEFKWFIRSLLRFRLPRARDKPKLNFSVEYPPSSDKSRVKRVRKITFDRPDERSFPVEVEEQDSGMRGAGGNDEDSDMYGS